MAGLVDTHCHIQSVGVSRADFTAKKWQEAGETDPDKIIADAKQAGVDRLICVGTDLQDSIDAVNFVADRENCWASVGVHPHEAEQFYRDMEAFEQMKALLKHPKIVAIGEVGLDYYYEHSPRDIQIKLLEQMLDLAKTHNLPVIFHVRDAHSDFWPILANFGVVRGVLHSFSSTAADLDKALSMGLYIGLNGIMTFTKDQKQLDSAKAVPLERLVLETDSPYLTPSPFRGKICKPEHIKPIAEFLCDLRGEEFSEFASQTSRNAQQLFAIS